jgi:hypothetical protein
MCVNRSGVFLGTGPFVHCDQSGSLLRTVECRVTKDTLHLQLMPEQGTAGQ